MEIIQQDFKTATRGFFFTSLIFAIYLTQGFFFEDYKGSTSEMWVATICCLFSSIMLGFATYYFSFCYELRQKEIIAFSLLRFWRKKKYSFEDLSKIEFVISTRGVIDTVNLYFGNQSPGNKLTIVSDIGKVRLFLFANVKNFEGLVVEKQRTWGR